MATTATRRWPKRRAASPATAWNASRRANTSSTTATYPKRYVRDIYNNVGIVMGLRKANRMIDSCTLCGLCDTLCPNDLAMGEVCLEARRDMVDSGHMPASHHDFALRDMAHSRSRRRLSPAVNPAAPNAPSPSFPAASYRRRRRGTSSASTPISPRKSPAASASWSIAAARRRCGAAGARCTTR